nr:ABC-F family ATP-binding cassette domain-containing protein [Gemmatimonadota bacterium]
NHLDILSIRWLEQFLHDFAGPVVVISHDHQFLDAVSTHILDVDYQTVTLYMGDYTAFLEEKRSERARREKEIEGRQKEIAHHQKFVDRFKAKASKARQAQSKLRMIEKKADELEELPGSSRRYPKFRFSQRRPSGRDVLKIEGVTKAFGEKQVLHGVDLLVRRGDRLVILGPNGIGKSTLLKIIMGEVDADQGRAEWGFETHPGYFAQDHHEQIADSDRTAEQWLWNFCPSKDRGFVRGHMGLMLFSGDDGDKRLSALSGGEAARLVFSRLALQQPNVLVLDEPTNHLDLESIEALVTGLQNYEGTLILVSHDRWFVRQLATRVVEISREGLRDFHGTYEEYVHACGDDHLDADTVVLKARREEKQEKRRDSRGNGGKPDASGARGSATRSPADRKKLERRRDEITAEIEAAEARIAQTDQAFCEPGFYQKTSSDAVAVLEGDRTKLQERLETLMREWERVEAEMEVLR